LFDSSINSFQIIQVSTVILNSSLAVFNNKLDNFNTVCHTILASLN